MPNGNIPESATAGKHRHIAHAAGPLPGLAPARLCKKASISTPDFSLLDTAPSPRGDISAACTCWQLKILQLIRIRVLKRMMSNGAARGTKRVASRIAKNGQLPFALPASNLARLF
jgi:hypothetical protein